MPSLNKNKVKICGLSEESTLRAAIDAGADMVGFVHFPKSPRHVSLARAAELKKLLPPNVKSVIVTVNPSDDLVNEILGIVNPDYIQLHGNETLDQIAQIHAKTGIIKAIPVSTPDDIVEMACDMLMFDAKPPKEASLPGGNGIAFDWKILKGFQTMRPWMLSGGLTPENVQQAIRESGATFVDVSSGVENKPGVKDAGKIKAFIETAKA
ncbi:MAG: phosphoribosylanthranilate isomerase [Alphaproteobacteria bacterium]|nr:phosphoribosylanthranilate isomerase [Alphaproteobacteria bacterium]